jgi:hypothetical protein
MRQEVAQRKGQEGLSGRKDREIKHIRVVVSDDQNAKFTV